jgi:hypothetical protein
VSAEGAGEDTRGLDRRRERQVVDDEERPDRDVPLPPLACGIVLWIADDLDDREDVLPARRVAEREIALLQTRAARGRVPCNEDASMCSGRIRSPVPRTRSQCCIDDVS